MRLEAACTTARQRTNRLELSATILRRAGGRQRCSLGATGFRTSAPICNPNDLRASFSQEGGVLGGAGGEGGRKGKTGWEKIFVKTIRKILLALIKG